MMRELLDRLEVKVCNRQFFLVRSQDLTRRVEEAFGPLYPFAARLAAGHTTTLEIARLHQVLLRTEAARPSAVEIERWSYEQGVLGHEHLSAFLIGLVLGDVRRERAAEQIAKQKQPEAGALT